MLYKTMNYIKYELDFLLFFRVFLTHLFFMYIFPKNRN